MSARAHSADRRDRRLPDASVVVPAYAEGAYLADTLHELARFARDRDPEARDGSGAAMLEVIVVDDGSPDDTSDVALSAKDDLHDDPLIDVRLLRHVRNRGKGAAVRTGVLGARGGVIVFTDADLAYGTTPLGKIIATIEAGADVVVGERHRHRSRLRGIAGFAFAQVVRVAGLGTSADPQCGIKGFSAAAAQLLFGLATIDGFAIDVEILYLARAYGLDVRTIEVEMREPEHSSVNLVSDARQMLASLRAIRRASAAGRYEIPAPSPRARVGFPR